MPDLPDTREKSNVLNGDQLQYVIMECASYPERIDENFCVIRDMSSHKIIGFTLENWSKVINRNVA